MELISSHLYASPSTPSCLIILSPDTELTRSTTSNIFCGFHWHEEQMSTLCGIQRDQFVHREPSILRIVWLQLYDTPTSHSHDTQYDSAQTDVKLHTTTLNTPYRLPIGLSNPPASLKIYQLRSRCVWIPSGHLRYYHSPGAQPLDTLKITDPIDQIVVHIPTLSTLSHAKSCQE